MNRFHLLLLSALVSVSALKAQNSEARFQQILDSVYQSRPEAVGMIVHVEAPDLKISWTGAIGVSDKESKKSIRGDQPALIASNTKTFVAVAIMKLVETGNLKLSDPIEDLISEGSKNRLGRKYALDQIVVRHLLSHTSGIADYVNDDYFSFIDKHRNYTWTREEQIALSAKQKGPLAEPGQKFKYGDINYLLLTEILETKTKMPFYQAIRLLIDYNGTGLSRTWFVNLEPAPADSRPQVHQYWSKFNWDSYDLNPSWDLHGGGGLATTAKDLAFFFQRLFEGKILLKQESLDVMTEFVLPKETSNYTLGMRMISFHGTMAYYHGGFWGTDAMYVPEYNASLSAFTLQKDERGLNEKVHAELLKVLKKSANK